MLKMRTYRVVTLAKSLRPGAEYAPFSSTAITHSLGSAELSDVLHWMINRPSDYLRFVRGQEEVFPDGLLAYYEAERDTLEPTSDPDPDEEQLNVVEQAMDRFEASIDALIVLIPPPLHTRDLTEELVRSVEHPTSGLLWFYVPNYRHNRVRLGYGCLQCGVEEHSAEARRAEDGDADVVVIGPHDAIQRFRGWLLGSNITGLMIEGKAVAPWGDVHPDQEPGAPERSDEEGKTTLQGWSAKDNPEITARMCTGEFDDGVADGNVTKCSADDGCGHRGCPAEDDYAWPTNEDGSLMTVSDAIDKGRIGGS